MDILQSLVLQKKAFCGITPQYTYAITYPQREKPKITIAFTTEGFGWLYNEFTTKYKCQIKAEGGGSLGLVEEEHRVRT